MYYIGNIEYFLKKEGYSDMEITGFLERFEKNKVKQEDEGNIQTALVVSGAVSEVLGEDMASLFRRQWESDSVHHEIAFAKGVVPERYLTRG